MPRKKVTVKPKKISKTKFIANLKNDVAPESCFVLVNGNRISNLKQLATDIDRITDEVFYYHVSEYKNDFLNWIRDVIKDDELSEKLADIKDKKDMQLCILKYIVKRL